MKDHQIVPQKVTDEIPTRPTGDALIRIRVGYHYTSIRWNVKDTIESRETHCDFISDLNELLESTGTR